MPEVAQSMAMYPMDKKEKGTEMNMNLKPRLPNEKHEVINIIIPI